MRINYYYYCMVCIERLSHSQCEESQLLGLRWKLLRLMTAAKDHRRHKIIDFSQIWLFQSPYRL
jgi:hypothetical protein